MRCVRFTAKRNRHGFSQFHSIACAVRPMAKRIAICRAGRRNRHFRTNSSRLNDRRLHIGQIIQITAASALEGNGLFIFDFLNIRANTDSAQDRIAVVDFCIAAPFCPRRMGLGICIQLQSKRVTLELCFRLTGRGVLTIIENCPTTS